MEPDEGVPPKGEQPEAPPPSGDGPAEHVPRVPLGNPFLAYSFRQNNSGRGGSNRKRCRSWDRTAPPQDRSRPPTPDHFGNVDLSDPHLPNPSLATRRMVARSFLIDYTLPRPAIKPVYFRSGSSGRLSRHGKSRMPGTTLPRHRASPPKRDDRFPVVQRS